jgi:hypothetical protein
MKEKIRYEEKDYDIRYKHERYEEDKEVISKYGRPLKISAKTIAYIAKEDNTIILKGESFCSVKDQFNKKLGRRIAKGRLLKQL